MKEYRKNRILREFWDFDRTKAKKLLSDFIEARRTLLPTKEYKEHLYSRLEALRYKKESNVELIKRYFSSVLAFTFVVSVVWLFYTQNDFTWVPLSEDISVAVMPAQLSEDMSEVMWLADMWVRSMMIDADMTFAWTDEEKETFGQICTDNWGFFIEDEYICILDTVDMCGLESLRTAQDNSCNIFFIWEKDDIYDHDAILPYEGQ